MVLTLVVKSARNLEKITDDDHGDTEHAKGLF